MLQKICKYGLKTQPRNQARWLKNRSLIHMVAARSFSVTQEELQKMRALQEKFVHEPLMESDLGAVNHDPMKLFDKWHQEAKTAIDHETCAGCLATCGDDMKPVSSFVVVRSYDDRGFVWYTNYESRKSHILDKVNPNAALTFWWPQLERMVRVEGLVSKVPSDESDKYFSSRPRESQIHFWASEQTKAIDSRDSIY